VKRFIAVFLLALFGLALGARATEKTYVNSIGMEFVQIPAGSFTMGTDKDFEDAIGDEAPRHRVTISRPFFLGRYEVTQDQWKKVMGGNPSRFQGGSNPVDSVSWNDVQTFIERLNRSEETRNHRPEYRLPTEAEWEYAARAGTASVYSFGNDAGRLGEYAWYAGNSREEAHPVGQKRPNPWGLYDMHGNVWEWVQDWYDGNYYFRSPAIDPRGPTEGRLGRVMRGGAWNLGAWLQRSTRRLGFFPEYRHADFGFRLAFSPGTS
jgi:formylglycine-generating enzyme required for sulfatase activity